GRYVLSYGGVPSPGAGAAQPDASSVAAGVEAAWIEPGPEEEARSAPLPAAAAPGAALSRERFRASWAVMAAGAVAGDLVRLALPDAVYAQARPDLGDLRLVTGGRQVPYVRWTPPDPVPVAERADLRPEAEKGRHYSRIEIWLPAAGPPAASGRPAVAAPPAGRLALSRYGSARPGAARGAAGGAQQLGVPSRAAAALPARPAAGRAGAPPPHVALR